MKGQRDEDPCEESNILENHQLWRNKLTLHPFSKSSVQLIISQFFANICAKLAPLENAKLVGELDQYKCVTSFIDAINTEETRIAS